MVCQPALVEWQSRNDRPVVRGRDAMACGNRETTAPGVHRALRHECRLLRGVDVPGRRADVVVRLRLDPGPVRGAACERPRRSVTSTDRGAHATTACRV